MAEAHSFPLWLKLRRRGLGWTQEQLAKRCFCAVITVKRIESGDLAPSIQLAESLGRELNIPAERLAEFVSFARTTEMALPANHFETVAAPPATALVTVKHRVPSPLSSFVGRVVELADVRSLLAEKGVRLLTLIGPAGSGKTRLAHQVALRMQDDRADGACFVPLSACRTETDVLNAISRAVQVKQEAGIPLGESVANHLAQLDLLMVLDNFEHVMSAAPMIETLLQRARLVTALVTSREPLRLIGEHEYSVAPLAPPHPGEDAILAAQNEAVRLFAERVRAIRPDFALHHGNVGEVSELCRLVDGVPLAIEMAAARAKYSPLPAIIENLRNSLTTLGTSLRDAETRHRTLRDAIAWSVDLLTPDLQELYCMLGALEGGCTEETVAQMMAPEHGGSFDTGRLYQLCEASLLRLRRLPSGQLRFSQLGIFREDARARLRQSGRLDALVERAARIYGELARKTQAALYGPDQPRLLDELDAEHANIQAAFRWALTHDAELALRIAAVMTDARYVRGQWAESHAALASAVSVARSVLPNPTLNAALAHALRNYGFMSYCLGETGQALALNEEALAMAQSLADEPAIAAVERNLGMVHRELADLDAALKHFEASLAISQRLANESQVAWLEELIGQVHMSLGNAGRAQEMLANALALRRKLGGQRGIAETLFWLGRNEFYAGQFDASAARMRDCVQMTSDARDAQGNAMALCGLAAVLQRLGQLDEAADAAQRAVPIMRALKFRKGLAWALNEAGEVHLACGRRNDAVQALGEGAQIAYALKDWFRAAACLDALAEARLAENATEAAKLFGGALRLRAEARMGVLASERERHERLAALLSTQQDAVHAGRTVPFDQLPIASDSINNPA